MEYNISGIARLLNLREPDYPNHDISVLLTDSRSLTYPDESLFFALRTPNNDGHRYIAGLVGKGVKNFVVEEIPADVAGVEDVNFLVVPDVKEALHTIARHHRHRYDIPVIGITGSRGKTTLKEWLYQLLQRDLRIVRSPRSYNSQIGVPLSVWEINDDSELGIFEAGISQPGEMDALREIVDPTIGILTNVGAEHAGGFSSRREKCDEKIRLFTGCDTLVYCTDDTDVNAALESAGLKARLVGWSLNDADAPVQVSVEKGDDSSRVVCRYNGDVSESVIPFTDAASVENAIAAQIMLMLLDVAAAEIASRMAALTPVNTRLNVIEGVNDCMLIFDTYTSDYHSLAPALDFMQRRATADRTSTLILSDVMHETMTPDALYANIAHLIRCKGINRLIGIGEEISAHACVFGDDARFYKSTDEFLSDVIPDDFHNELILIKGAGKFGFNRLNDLLEARQHETVLEVNLDAVVHNFNNFRSRIKPTTGIVAMVKASGYGAGSYELAKTLQSQGAAYLAVAVADEAMDLRKAGITMPIMVLNPKVVNYATMFTHNLEPEIYSFDILEEIIREGALHGVKNYPVHIKLDTGMHRLGFLEKDMPRLVEMLQAQDVISPRSVFSHLAAADAPEMDDYSREQFAIFARCCDVLQAGFSHHILRHILNSTGITRFPEYQYDMVRLGICLYGIPTLPDRSQGDLQPVSSLSTVIIAIKEWEAGTTIGYNRRGVLHRRSRIATIPIGYADGLNRHLGNGHSTVLVNGHRCPTVGNICMDICMIDVTDVDCEVGDTVEIFGRNISVMEIADTLGTIPYEVLTSVSSRVKRVYYRE